MTGSERRLAAILFTDILGYTALMGASEERGLRARARHRKLVRPWVERYHGEPIEARGDESLSIFASAHDAVNCALAIQAALAEDPDQLQLHIGIHMGEIMLRDGEVTGDGVNIASRICSLSDGTGPHVSDVVQHAVQNQENLCFESLGEQELKNVSRTVPVYRVSGLPAPPRHIPVTQRFGVRRPRRWLASAAVPLTALAFALWSYFAPVGATPIRSLAVLPLANLSGDPAQEYFTDGMTEALIGDLAKIRDLGVISRTSVLRFKGTEKPLQEIAQELGVDAVVEGTVMRVGGRVRITAQLIDARTDRHLWAERYDRDLEDVLSVHAGVARAVANQIQLELTPTEEARLTGSATVDAEAYDAYMRGLAQQEQAGVESLLRAVEFFERSVELDPSFAPAFVELAWSNQLLVTMNRYQVPERLERMRRAAERALELDDQLAGAHTMLAIHHWLVDFDWERAGEGLALALELGPNDRITLEKNSWFLAHTGRHEESIELAERALELAPFDLLIRHIHLEALVMAGRCERHNTLARELLETDPKFGQAGTVRFWMLDCARELDKDPDEIFALLEELMVDAPPEFAESTRKRYRDSGLDGVFRMLLPLVRPNRDLLPFTMFLAASIGDADIVLEQYALAVESRSSFALTLLSMPFGAPFREEPRIAELMRQIGHPLAGAIAAESGRSQATLGARRDATVTDLATDPARPYPVLEARVGAPEAACTAPASHFEVTTVSDASHEDAVCLKELATRCSLRDAISAANADPDPSLISFATRGTIEVGSETAGEALPVLTQPVCIDAQSAPGWIGATETAGATLTVALDGTRAERLPVNVPDWAVLRPPEDPDPRLTPNHVPIFVDGLVVLSDDVVIRGLEIYGFLGAGIRVGDWYVDPTQSDSADPTKVSRITIAGNHIGDLSGSHAKPNSHGIVVIDGSYIQIGGVSPEGRRNQLRNVISGNGRFIASSEGSRDLAGRIDLHLATCATPDPSGPFRQPQYAYALNGRGAIGCGGTFHHLVGNYFGPGPDGTGVKGLFSTGDMIEWWFGAHYWWAHNVIGASLEDAMEYGAYFTGLDYENESSLPVRASVISDNIVGADVRGEPLRVRGGIVAFRSEGNLFRNNWIGNASWTAINIAGNSNANVVRDNVLVANDGGIALWNRADGNRLEGNRIGVDASGNARGNRFGVWAGTILWDEVNPSEFWPYRGPSSNLITENVIAHNEIGVAFGEDIDAFVASLCEADPSPGSQGGLLCSPSFTGWWNPETKWFDDRQDGTSRRNTVSRNAIFGNERIGIDHLVASLENVQAVPGLVVQVQDGPTPNDQLDEDFGANGRQNAPELDPASSWRPDELVLRGRLHSRPSRSFVVELFASHRPGPSGVVQGERYLDSVEVTTDAGGNASFEHRVDTVDPLADGSEEAWISATATDSAGNTSEFSEGLFLELSVGSR